MEAVNWVLKHYAEILAVVAGLISVASLITGLTPTPKDDEALASVKGFLRQIGLLKHADEPGTLKLPGAK